MASEDWWERLNTTYFLIRKRILKLITTHKTQCIAFKTHKIKKNGIPPLPDFYRTAFMYKYALLTLCHLSNSSHFIFLVSRLFIFFLDISPQRLLHLSLSNNWLGDTCCSLLNTVISSLSSLETLELASCGFTSKLFQQNRLSLVETVKSKAFWCSSICSGC